MQASIECKHCYGLGRVHSPGCNGDPDDEGVQCESCEGAGVIDVELEDFCEES